jgi:hypothetical protein
VCLTIRPVSRRRQDMWFPRVADASNAGNFGRHYVVNGSDYTPVKF